MTDCQDCNEKEKCEACEEIAWERQNESDYFIQVRDEHDPTL